MNATMKNKRAPAQDGARFDAAGFCIVHSDVRLCRFTAEGKQLVVRKICPKCGVGASLAHTSREKKKTKKRSKPPPRVHSSRKPTPHPRQGVLLLENAARESARATKGEQQQPKTKSERRETDRPVRRTERHHNRRGLLDVKEKDACVEKGERQSMKPNPERREKSHPAPGTQRRISQQSRRSKSPPKKVPGRSRGRTLSPIRQSLPKSSPKRPLSSSEVLKKSVTAEKIRELRRLMPPLCKPPSTKKVAADAKTGRSSGTKSSKSDRSFGSTSQNMPFDKSGHCRAHPEVKLAEKGPSSEQWQIVSGVCPRCCISAVLACQQDEPPTSSIVVPRPTAEPGSSSPTHTGPFDALLAKKLQGKRTSGGSQQTQPTATTSSSSCPATPESASKPAFSDRYFTSANRNIVGLALDIVESERTERVGSREGLARPVGPVTDGKPTTERGRLGESCASGVATIRAGNVVDGDVVARDRDPSPSKEPPGRRPIG